MSFSEFLRKNNLIPPDIDMPTQDEYEQRKEYIEANSDQWRKIRDHDSDVTHFEICVVNKKNEGLIVQAIV